MLEPALRPSAFLLFFPILLAAQNRNLRLEPSSTSAPPRRVALAIGNNAYPGNALQNAVRDAQDVAGALRALGFEVQQIADADLRNMESSIDRFIGGLHGGDVGLFYYSGHGVQVDGENYLIPVNFNGRDEREVKYQAYAVGRVHERMAATGARLSIVILDACRNNPFRGARSGAKGWAAMATASGSFIAFATAPNATASDNPNERNGLFTKYVLENLDRTGVGLGELFDKVRSEVYEASGQRQLPWIASSVIGEFVFHDPALEEKRLADLRVEVAGLEGALKEAEARQAGQQAEQARAELRMKQMELERQQQEAARRAAEETRKRKQAEEQAQHERERQANEQRLAELRQRLADPRGPMTLEEARQQVAALRKQMAEAEKAILALRDRALDDLKLDQTKGLFETTAEYQARQQKYQQERAPIEQRYAADAASASRPYADRITALTGRTYPLAGAGVKLTGYDADRGKLTAEVNGAEYVFDATPAAAKGLYDRKELIRVETTYNDLDSGVGAIVLADPPSGTHFGVVMRVKDGLTYVWIPPGTFQMGCSQVDDECDSDEKPAHQVTISRGFWIGQTEVTQESYQKVIAKDPSRFKGAKHPVENVSWDDARSYCLV